MEGLKNVNMTLSKYVERNTLFSSTDEVIDRLYAGLYNHRVDFHLGYAPTILGAIFHQIQTRITNNLGK